MDFPFVASEWQRLKGSLYNSELIFNGSFTPATLVELPRLYSAAEMLHWFEAKNKSAIGEIGMNQRIPG